MQPLVHKSEKVSCLQFRDVLFSALDKCCGLQADFGPLHGQFRFDSDAKHNCYSIRFWFPYDAKFVELDFVLRGV